jgi:hypothetical protein
VHRIIFMSNNSMDDKSFLEKVRESQFRIQNYENSTGLPYSTSPDYKKVEKAILEAQSTKPKP